jgi:two-component system cell cycle sensor histidine kinase/response regulator CckA
MSQKNKEAWLLESIVENIPTMIFLKDASQLRFELFNKAGEDLLGLSRDVLHGKNDFDFFPREQAEFFTNKDREVLAGQKPISVEEPIQTPKGERWLLTRKVPLVDEAGEARFLLGISLDITERRKAEQELKQTLEQLLAIEPLVQVGKQAQDVGREIVAALDAGDVARARLLAARLAEIP